jgi:hypothetical protein
VTETIKLFFTYLIALVVVLGGGYMLYATRGEAGADNLQLVVSGFIGAALAFVFGGEIQTRTARQQERALMTGAPTVTYTAADPSSTEVTQ